MGQSNVILADDIRAVLSDRDWHTGMELIEYFMPRVPPEAAGQYYWTTRSRKGASEEADIPADLLVRNGVREMISRAIRPHLDSGMVQQVGGSGVERRRYRWIGWYCWLCGEKVSGVPERPSHGLCLSCEETSGTGGQSDGEETN